MQLLPHKNCVVYSMAELAEVEEALSQLQQYLLTGNNRLPALMSEVRRIYLGLGLGGMVTRHPALGVDQNARQTPSFRAGKDSADAKGVLVERPILN